MIGALIAAAGSGERLGLGPKAFVRVGGTTLLDLCLEGLIGAVSEVVVALPPGVGLEAHDWGARFDRFVTVTGGADRQSSVRLMLDESSSEVVLVHDVARPFVTPADAARVAAAASSVGAATAAVAVADTLVVATSGETVDRSKLRAVQTPQGFRRGLLVDAHAAAARDAFAATDDAALVRRLGLHVELVAGSKLLNKLTEPGDLLWAEAVHDVWRRTLDAQRSGA